MGSGWKCKRHTTGVEPNTPAFYVPGCCVCERKKAAGLITGNEGPPLRREETLRVKRLAATNSQRRRCYRASA